MIIRGSVGNPELARHPECDSQGVFPIDGSRHELAVVIGLLTLVTLLLWDKFKRGRAKLIPGALVGIVIASAVAAGFRLPVYFVTVPDDLLEAVTLPTASSLSILLNPSVVLSALALAFIASAETLLCATAVDRLQTLHRAEYDRELTAQGVGNFLCGVLGALPMTGVIVRSSANVQAGAQSRMSAILHGFYLLVFVALIPGVLRYIPTAGLGAILVFTGYKLVDPCPLLYQPDDAVSELLRVPGACARASAHPSLRRHGTSDCRVDCTATPRSFP